MPAWIHRYSTTTCTPNLQGNSLEHTIKQAEIRNNDGRGHVEPHDTVASDLTLTESNRVLVPVSAIGECTYALVCR